MPMESQQSTVLEDLLWLMSNSNTNPLACWPTQTTLLQQPPLPPPPSQPPSDPASSSQTSSSWRDDIVWLSNMTPSDEKHLPPTKIKRSYKCTTCGNNTCNPRTHLRHRQQVHGHKIKIVLCPLCLYACQYRQKLHRHLRLVHKILSPAELTAEYDAEMPMDLSVKKQQTRQNQTSSSSSLSLS